MARPKKYRPPESPKPAAKGHRIAFYIRVSTEEQASNPEGSIKNQKERLLTAVQLKNLEGVFGEVAEIYVDRARSGKDTNRPELQRLLNAIRAKEISLVMVSELSRLSRSIKDFAGIWELMQANGCGFLSLRENFDTTTAAGEMVLYTVANIAQFERRQIAERVTANIHARAKRGLYNGGCVPLGYRLIPDKKGYLEVDPEQAEIVRKAFSVFLFERNLTSAAKWLNANGVRYKKTIQGGGNAPRLGHFTTQNLACLLKNKAYVGIKTYKEKGVWKEAPAVWEPIIEPTLFQKTQELIARNFDRKPHDPRRYPYLLTGVLKCGHCGERLCGKTAHGAKGAIVHYYDHAWALKRQSCLKEKVFHCDPVRINARWLEPVVWQEVEKLLTEPKVVDRLIADAKAAHGGKSRSEEIERVRQKIYAYKNQIDALTERLAQLPASVPAEPIYQAMERIHKSRSEEEENLARIQNGEGDFERPVERETYGKFLEGLRAVAENPELQHYRAQIIQTLVQKVEVFPETFKMHFLIGKNYIERELAHAGSRLFYCPGGSLKEPNSNLRGGGAEKEKAGTFLSSGISSKLIFGVPTGIRTPVTPVKGECPRPLDDGNTSPSDLEIHFLT